MQGKPPPPDIHVDDMLDSVSDAVVVIRDDWTVLYINNAYMELVKRLFSSADQLLGRNLWEAFPDIRETEVGKFYQRTMADQTAGSMELFYQPLQVWLEVRAFPSPRVLSLYVRDISERKKHETEVNELTKLLREQAGMFDTVLSNLPDLSYAFDRDIRVIYANKPLLKLWGRELPDVLGKNLFEMDYPYDLAVRLTNEMRQVIETGEPFRGEVAFIDAHGVEDIHDYIYNPIFGANGEVVGVAGTTRLVTDQRAAEKATRQLAAIVAFSDDAIISKNLDGIIQSWNEGAERLFGYTAEEIIGRSILLLIPEDRYDEEKSIIARIRAGKRIEHFETMRRHKSGRLIPISLSVSPIKDSEGHVVGASKIARDNTEQRAVMAALKEAKDAAETANRSKDRFLAVLSHELRTPLTPALMTVSAMEQDVRFPAEYQPDIAMIRRNIELETKLIDDLLDVSRIISGKLNLQKDAIDMNGLIEHVCEICRPQITEKALILDTHLAPDLPRVHADSSRLQQVLWNIVKNAAKFTPKGGRISITTRRIDGMAEAVVVDTGAGISPSNLEKIFEAFEQGDPETTRQFGGLGLGLAISKVIVELHGGSITAESEGPGKGSQFTVRFPIHRGSLQPQPESTPPRNPAPKEKMHLLLVEDHPDTAMMLARLLKSAGYTTETASSVSEALKLASSHSFDVVVSDVGLPDASGYDLMRTLRERGGIKGIAMSGYGMESDIRKSLEAGFSTHLVKPIDFMRLENALRELVARS